MRFRKIIDLDAIAAEIEARHVARDVEVAAMRLTAPPTESRLLAALICSPAARSRAFEVESDDFTDYRYRAAFASLRGLEACGDPIGVLEIADDIAMNDLATDKVVSETVGVAFLGSLLADEPPYYGNEQILARDIAWLRTLRVRRDAL